MTDSPDANAAAYARSGLLSWPGRGLHKLSDRVHAADDADAVARGWTVTATVSRLGMIGRNHRNPRFDSRKVASSPAPGEDAAAIEAGGVTRQPVRLDQAIREWAEAHGFAQITGSAAREGDVQSDQSNRQAGA